MLVFAYLEMLFSLKYALTLLFKVDAKSAPTLREYLIGFSASMVVVRQPKYF